LFTGVYYCTRFSLDFAVILSALLSWFAALLRADLTHRASY
jgi:hypothetical protein